MPIVMVAVVAIVVAACTWLAGWWVVPVIGAIYVLFRRTRIAPYEAGIGAMVAWSALFLINYNNPAFGVLLRRLGGIFPVPGAVVLMLAVLIAGLLAWSAGRLAGAGITTDHNK